MSPALKSGDAVLIDPNANARIGDIVLVNHPYKSSVTILKRVAEIGANGNLTLIGDNAAESTDSRTFGTVSTECFIGKVVCRLK